MWDVRRADVISGKLQSIKTRFVRREGVVGISGAVFLVMVIIVRREWDEFDFD